MDWFHPGLTGPNWFQWAWIRQGYRPSPEAQRWVWNKIGLLWVLQPTQLFSKPPLQKYRKICLHSRLSPKLSFPESWIFYVCSRTSSYSPLPRPWKLSYYFSERNRAFVTTWESICLESREQSWSKVWGWAWGQARSLIDRLFPTCWPYSSGASDSNLSRMSACHEPWGWPQGGGHLNYLICEHPWSAILHKSLTWVGIAREKVDVFYMPKF